VATKEPSRPLYEVFLERVIRIDAVQRQRAAAVTDDEHTARFFDTGRRPGLFGDFSWSLDSPAAGDWGPIAPSATEKPVPMSAAMQKAWEAAVAEWRKLIAELASGEMIASGIHPVSRIRTETDRFEWSRPKLVLDVRNGELIEGWYGRPDGKHTVLWSAIVLQPAERAIPERKLGRIDWDDWWEHEITRRQQGSLPNEKGYLLDAEPLIRKRYEVTTVPPSELRRIKPALFRGDSERPKRQKRKQPKRKE
jgi:hypothetical protein